ncbi:RtcB family protein [Luteolibacter yonseiensis]|uniref:3'-phosphate/5'-hydroxy nucleic acid ligase n=1 Tax=Luteolibacter yonseiensis TaxID=1144680 RepID=A0A934R3Y7_9BACT|nr:RtcB family protein [Luteolibacter yonseiensis]MBK1815987.1 RtcB family protein [Luteolibacter yonseiensis]
MKTKDLRLLGVPDGEPMQHAQDFIRRYMAEGHEGRRLGEEIFQIVADPSGYFQDPLRAPLARSVYRPAYTPRAELAPWRQWGDDLEADAVRQMANSCALPVAVAGALMSDAHPGYGLPIGGVLATENAVIPYAVGVDIACRMKLTVYDRKAGVIAGQRDRLANIIESETRFGIGCTFKDRRNHDVMDDDWSVSPVTRRLRDKAWTQLGTSGSGNHFVEFGAFTVTDDELGFPPGEYLALLSHSGSRGTGAMVCDTYSKRAMARRSNLPKELKHLAWLTLDEEDGQEYWNAMNLMGRYAAANHELIHKHIAKKVGARVMLDIENHHNFAWKEEHVVNGRKRELIVHRKGATPAGKGVLGIIPGSMATPGFVVRGKGKPESLNSASHGAGRVMSRSKALQTFTWSGTKKLLAERGVELLSSGLDEVPGVYKDIHSVMSAQTDLVEVLGRFDPKIVKMCPPGERAED